FTSAYTVIFSSGAILPSTRSIVVFHSGHRGASVKISPMRSGVERMIVDVLNDFIAYLPEDYSQNVAVQLHFSLHQQSRQNIVRALEERVKASRQRLLLKCALITNSVFYPSLMWNARNG